MVRRALVILLAALVLWGCAAHPGIGRGHALTARGDYRGALAAYQEALAADPDDAELHAIVDRIRPFARDQAAGDVDDALSRGAYEEAVEHARYVERLDPEMGREALDRVQHVMIATAETLFATGRPREAYPIAVRTSRLFPEARGLGATFGKLRRHFRRESDLALARGDYPGALAALDVIEHNEPALAGELAGPRRTIVVAWADALVVEGEDELARGHTGIATARFAKAYEVAGRAQDGDRMRAGLSALRELGEVQLSLVVAGDPSRNQGFEQRLVTAALAEQGVVLVDGEDGVTVGALARLAPLACTQSVSHETREQDYVAGYRDVENPAFVSLSARIADGLRHLDDLASRVERARRERQRHAGEVERCQRDDEAPADRKAEAAEAELARAEEKVERARDELRRREDELRRGQGDQAQVDRAREELRQREAEASRVRQRAQDARRDQQEAHRRCDGERQAVTRADEDLSRRRGELRGARRDLDQLESERASTPATIQEPIIETYRYDVAQHERRCQGAV
ncbi:MAG: tetratricopeptide repeat protein, partial [Myxococcales bacterium]|nr:tetratricopeptide repeat protein [Myxococcales bacterium]